MPFDGCLKQADLLDLPFRLFAGIPAREFVAGQGKHNGHKRLSVGREDILDYAYIGINNDHCRRAAVADCDNDRWKRHFTDGKWIDQSAGCPVPIPPPNMIVENGDGSGRAHLIWLHREAFLTLGARIDMKSWTNQICAGLTIALEADRNYRANKLVKNPLWSGCDPWGKPLGPAHRLTVLHDRIYDLHDFDAVKRLAPPNRKGADVDLATCTEKTNRGRNCHLFELLRLATYPRYHPELTFDDYVCIIKYELLPPALPFVLAAHPVATHPFTDGEIDRMIRQIAKFMVNKYQPPGRLYKECNRGVMGLAGTGLDIQVKRRMAAGRTNGMRTDETVELFRAYRRTNPTAKAAEIAKAIGRSVRHVYRLLKQFVAPPVEKPVSPPVINTVKPSPLAPLPYDKRMSQSDSPLAVEPTPIPKETSRKPSKRLQAAHIREEIARATGRDLDEATWERRQRARKQRRSIRDLPIAVQNAINARIWNKREQERAAREGWGLTEGQFERAREEDRLMQEKKPPRPEVPTIRERIATMRKRIKAMEARWRVQDEDSILAQ